MQDISVLILTFNEEKHIRRCIESLQSFAKDIFIVDCYSTDRTTEIALSLGARVYQNQWKNYATQFNWGLKNCPIKTKWVMRMDADEYVTPALCKEINERLSIIQDEITGIYVKRKIFFMNKWIKYGGLYPLWLLRIWEHNKGYCEQRWMDEHIKLVEGATIYFSHDIVDCNLNNLTWWTSKHNNYATREAIDILNIRHKFLVYDEVDANILGTQVERKRLLKKWYAHMPLLLRPFIYFIYRYLIRLGFLDGKEGLVWHFLQGFWYRFLVDAKILELERRVHDEKKNIREALKELYNIDV